MNFIEIQEEDEEDESEFTPVKVVLVGDSGVGKTSIITRYLKNTFAKSLVSTTGASFANKLLKSKDGERIKLEIWDTAGQEKYRSLNKIFYNNASIVVLVYDITVRESFESLKEFWINEIKENLDPDIVLAIAGNKCDNYDEEKVTIDEGKDLANKNEAIFKQVSAKNNLGIKELFDICLSKYINPNMKELNSTASLKKEVEEYKRKMKSERQKKLLAQNISDKNRRKCCG